MPIKGAIITNPETGDSFEFLETAADTDGAKVVIKATIQSKGQVVPKHFHALQDETFEVLSGKLTIWRNGSTETLCAGEKLTLRKNIPHNHFNSEGIPVTYIHTVIPALDFDFLLENLIGLAADGKGKKGNFGLIQELVSLRYLDSKTYLAKIPVGIQKLLMNTIAPLARRFGYRALYKKYCGIEK